MIRAVLDTNIIVSAFFWGGLPREALNAAREKRYRILCTEELLAELKDVISRPKFAQRLEKIDLREYNGIKMWTLRQFLEEAIQQNE